MSDALPKAGEPEKATTDDKVNVLLALLVNALDDAKDKKEDEPAVSTLLAEGTGVSEPLLERLVHAVKARQNSKQQGPSLPNDFADSRIFRKHKSAQSCIACKKFIDSAMSDGCENPKCANPFAIHPDCIRTRLRNAKKLSIRCKACLHTRDYRSTAADRYGFVTVMRFLVIVLVISILPYAVFSYFRPEKYAYRTYAEPVLFSWTVSVMVYGAWRVISFLFRSCCMLPKNLFQFLFGEAKVVELEDARRLK
jgi:hypothetical protein